MGSGKRYKRLSIISKIKNKPSIYNIKGLDKFLKNSSKNNKIDLTKSSDTTKNHTQKSEKKPLKILLAHDNRLVYYTYKAHELSRNLNGEKDFDLIADYDHWGTKERTSSTETNVREKEMVQKADIIVRLIPPSSKTGEKRHEGAQSEVRKAINAGKPIIEIFMGGAKNSPNRSIFETNYKNRVEIHLLPGQSIEKGFYKGLDELRKKRIIKKIVF